MKRNNILRRITAALLALVLVLSLCLCPAVFAEGKTVRIGTKKDLLAFAEHCKVDTYSQGLTVTLTADIDAEETEISIPVFYGTFDGQGHRIYGLNLTRSAADYGLFSRIEAGAVVKDLAVEGDVTPSGTQSQIGGVAGVNAGRIEACSFSGIVIGGDYVGGIAGKNESSGVIEDCRTAGAVRGSQFTGGIAGQNAGTLLNCRNTAAVNTAVSDEDMAADISGLESTLYSLLKREDVSENAVTTDTGGIAGYSNGVVQSCVNSGTVGYPHVGYNVGGIAGRQNGYMASCINRGVVQGRKDVGGIVGQMAPDITLQFSSSGLDELQGELNVLHDLIDRALDDAQSASDTVSGGVSRLADYADGARDSAYSMAGQMGDFVDSNVETANNLLLLAERYLAKASPILEDLSAASDGMTQAIAALRQLVETVGGMEEYNEEALAALEAVCTEITQGCDALERGLAALEKALALITGTDNADITDAHDAISALWDAEETLRAALAQANSELAVGGAVTADTAAQLQAGLAVVLGRYDAAVSSTTALVAQMDLSGLPKLDLDTLRQAAAYLQSAAEAFAEASRHFRSAVAHLGEALDALRKINGEMGTITEQLDAALAGAEDASAALSSAFAKAAQWAKDLSGESPGSFVGLGSEFGESADALNSALGGIGNELTALNDEMSRAGTVLLADVRAVNDQFMKVMNLFLNVLNSTQNMDYSDVYEDVSEESLQSATRGKVLECTNYGIIDADRNVGGVAGSMAIEYDLDPEDDLLTSENRTTRFTYQTRAILLDCENNGRVQAKKSCAGGLVGRMDLGTVSGCGGYGDVSSENGDYVGGVCGLSLSSIRSSYAKCTLGGRKYVGGIVGSGSRVSDCLSMVEVTDCTQLGGAVAGEITGTYSGNYFVSDTLSGVDRISYAGKAEGITYEALCEREDTPDAFRSMQLCFVLDGETLQSQRFSYGASFESDVYPLLPEKENYYVHWDKSELKHLHFDTLVTAVYTPYVTTLASPQQRDGHDVLLVQGKFRDSDILQVREEENTASKAVETLSIQIPDDGQESHTVRWLLPQKGERYTVYVDSGNGAKKADAQVNGGYLSFTMAGDGTITLIHAGHGLWWLAIAAAAALAAAGAVVLLRRKRRHAADQNGETE